MTLQFPPKVGLVVVCNYDTGFREPEMVKTRLAVVMSPRLPKRDGLSTVVPLSTTPSRSGIKYQCKIELPYDAPPPFEGKIKWAKADMIATVAHDRLNLPFIKRENSIERRKYISIIINENEILKIRHAILHALGLGLLTNHL